MTLREQFEKETGTSIMEPPEMFCFRETYVEWLEQKLTDKRADQRFEAAIRIAAAVLANVDENEFGKVATDSVKQADALMNELEKPETI